MLSVFVVLFSIRNILSYAITKYSYCQCANVFNVSFLLSNSHSHFLRLFNVFDAAKPTCKLFGSIFHDRVSEILLDDCYVH